MPETTAVGPSTEKRIFSLGVNNRILPPTRFTHNFTPQDDRIARTGGPYKDRKLQFPEFLKILEDEKALMEKGEYKSKHNLTNLPLEIIYNICDYLPAKSISALCRAGNRKLSSFAQHVLYSEFNAIQWFHTPPTEEFYELPFHPQVGLWKEWALYTYWYWYKYKKEAEDKIIEHMSKLTGVERLVLKPGFEFLEEDVNEFVAQDYEVTLADRLGETLLCNLTQLIFCCVNPNSVRGILKHTKKLTRLSLHFDIRRPPGAKEVYSNFTGWNDMIELVGAEVGQTLRFFAIDIAHKSLDPKKHPFASLGDKTRWPHLEILCFGTTFFTRTSEPSGGGKLIEVMRLLKQVCNASLKHGGWTINRFVDGFNPHQFAILDVEETKKMVNWLQRCAWNKYDTSTDKSRHTMNYHLLLAGGDMGSRMLETRRGYEPWTGYIYINDNHLDPFLTGVDSTSLPRALQKIITTWSQAGIPLKIELQIERPSWKSTEFEAKEKLWKPLAPFLHSLLLYTTPCEDVEGLQAAIGDWIEFMENFLPDCHNLHSLRLLGAGEDMCPVFLLREHADILYNLCIKHKLRELDIDFGALAQPGTCPGWPEENPPQLGADIQEPRKVMCHVFWMTTPGGPEDPNDHKMLANLTKLTLRNTFVYRQIEMTWVGNIPAKLKKLEHLEFEGMVWSLGYDPEVEKQQRRALERAEAGSDDQADDDSDDGDDNGGHRRRGGGSKAAGNKSIENKEESKDKVKKKKGKEFLKGKSKPRDRGDEGWEDDGEFEEEMMNDPTTPHLEDEEPIKWHEPKNEGWGLSNGEETGAEKRKKKNKKKAANKKKRRLEKKLAEQKGIEDDEKEESTLGPLEGPSGSMNKSLENSDDEPVAGGNNAEESSKPKSKKKKKSKATKAATEINILDSSTFSGGGDENPGTAKKTRELVQTIETQFQKFNLGENNELANPTPHHDDGLLAWLPHKDDPTSSSDNADSDDDGDGDDDDSSENPWDNDGQSDVSSASTLFGSDPRYSRETNIRFRNLRHRDWLIRVLLETAQRTGGKCRDVKISGMKLNGKGHRPWEFDISYDADIDPFDWESDEYEDLEEWHEEGEEEAEFDHGDWMNEDEDEESYDEDEDDDMEYF